MVSEIPGMIDTPSRNFAVQLFNEHADEAALLYAQRAQLLATPPATGWTRLTSLEQRLEAHVDALRVGSELALATWSARKAAEPDAGEMYVGAGLLSANGQWKALHDLATGADPWTSETEDALTDALTRELPRDVEPAFRSLGSDHTLWTCVLLDVSARRRCDRRGFAIAALRSTDARVQVAAIRAIAELRDRRATTALHNAILTHSDGYLRSEAALALAKVADAHVVARCSDAARTENWPVLCLGITGGRSAVAVLLNLIDAGRATAHSLLGLGLLGEVGAVQPLIAHLGDHPLSPTAALALDLITGAALMESAVVEEIHEDELFDYETNSLTRSAEALDPGSGSNGTEERLSTDPERWRAWWAANCSRFAHGVRYRAGAPHTPNALVQCLTSDASSRTLRELAHNELTIRYGADVAFSTAMTVAEQKGALSRYVAWGKSEAARFKAGGWYYGGRLAPA